VGFEGFVEIKHITTINWELATKIGLQEKGMPKEYRVYEQAIANADALRGRLYGVAGVGLILELAWDSCDNYRMAGMRTNKCTGQIQIIGYYSLPLS
jgi:hypothetical protein